ncbi:MAG: ABC transporter ATP-binding protein [Alphaproteobacteria bacterium]|nr:ABC transporter ATP-binding protein [Alphaproteobacteria bacterium]
MAEIVLSGVTKRFGDFVAVHTLDLAVVDREFLVLLGPSGCGKTTTMRMIAGLEEPSAGEIRIGGRVVNDLPPRARDVAMVFQNYGLYPHMSVADNIGYPLKLRGVPREERAAQVRAVAAKVRLDGLLERKPAALSGGQRQRVGLARALIRKPTVFLMDEPLSNLDAKLRVEMRAELKHLHHELAVTTVYVTHDQIEAMTLATRVAVMNKGIIHQLGTPDEIYNEPADLFVAGFIGSPAMNLIDGRIDDGTFVAGRLRIDGLGRSTRESVVLGIRPEDMTIGPAGSGHGDLPVYSSELTGDSTLITLADGNTRIAVRADKTVRPAIDDVVALRIDPRRCYLFDAATTRRLAI